MEVLPPEQAQKSQESTSHVLHEKNNDMLDDLCMNITIKQEPAEEYEQSTFQDETASSSTKIIITQEPEKQIKQEAVPSDNEAKSKNLFSNDEFLIKIEKYDLEDENVRIFKCARCGANFNFEYRCQYHLITVHESQIKPYPCSFCKSKHSTRPKLLAHLRRHTNEKKILCKICSEYYYYWEVSKHLQNCPKRKRYNCNECEYSTGKKYEYLTHIRLHTGERPYKCSRCGLGLINCLSLKKHLRIHRNEKPYECHFCHKRFKSESVRNSHIVNFYNRKCIVQKCKYNCINCKDLYIHVAEFHGHTKLKKILLKSRLRYYTPVEQNEWLRTKSKRKSECYICHLVFKTKIARNRHLVSMSGKKCSITECKYVSINCKDFYTHVKDFHENPTIVKTETVLSPNADFSVSPNNGCDLAQENNDTLATDEGNLRAIMYSNLV